MNRLRAISGSLLYSRIIGTGGIGSGIFFMLDGDETLGREESRLARLSPYKDYCKLHIIMHYIATLIGDRLTCIPIGCVGDDLAGRTLISEMRAAGIDVDNVKVSKGLPTLFSVCYQYPNRDGGNITTSESASSSVSLKDVDDCLLSRPGPEGGTEKTDIILAVPEVPLQTRIHLLRHGREAKSLNVSSVTTAEIDEFKKQKGLELTDYLFINIDEAKKFAGQENDFVEKAIENIIASNPAVTIFITAGSKGAYCFHKGETKFTPSIEVEVKSTAGAGDTFLAGTLCGICCGLDVFDATQIGMITAAASVTSGDTINHNINADYLLTFAKSKNIDQTLLKIINRLQWRLPIIRM